MVHTGNASQTRPIFTQLFHEQSNNEDFAVVVRSIDYSALRTSPLAHRSGHCKVQSLLRASPGRPFVASRATRMSRPLRVKL